VLKNHEIIFEIFPKQPTTVHEPATLVLPFFIWINFALSISCDFLQLMQ